MNTCITYRKQHECQTKQLLVNCGLYFNSKLNRSLPLKCFAQMMSKLDLHMGKVTCLLVYLWGWSTSNTVVTQFSWKGLSPTICVYGIAHWQILSLQWDQQAATGSWIKHHRVLFLHKGRTDLKLSQLQSHNIFHCRWNNPVAVCLKAQTQHTGVQQNQQALGESFFVQRIMSWISTFPASVTLNTLGCECNLTVDEDFLRSFW